MKVEANSLTLRGLFLCYLYHRDKVENTKCKLKSIWCMWTFIIIALIVIIVGVVLQSNANAKEDNERGAKLNNIITQHPDFSPSIQVKGIKNFYTFAVDHNNRKVLYSNSINIYIIDFEQIISVEIEEDNSIVMQKSTLRTIGGALLGKSLAGEAGMIVGGLSGSSNQKKNVSNVNVKIRLRDINNPSILISCFNSRTMTTERKSEIKTDGIEGHLYRQGLADAKKITDIITVIIDSVDNKSNSSKPIFNKTNNSIADELSKLVVLKEAGVLTEEEFTQQKSMLLNGHQTNSLVKPAEVNENISPELLAEVEKGNLIVAVKMYIDATGVSLAEAKRAIDSLKK